MRFIKAVLIAIGLFHLTTCSIGSVGLIDYHVCVKSTGMCGEHGETK